MTSPYFTEKLLEENAALVDLARKQEIAIADQLDAIVASLDRNVLSKSTVSMLEQVLDSAARILKAGDGPMRPRLSSRPRA